ncbi:tryptophan halogenase family protein [Sphingomonas nostoxanthinifaciens]|uniref:tryptophan halogenase family protein n=1 Tax=Sphingomonas nostoxanthinifaciens TaxID=2872652 RepID=UPI001CC1C34F|nr:tryptophan halogenase family protein [Sphingomonas nostoxanthinifaciens]UAK23377.1 tryptophan 7-halogenase [Sphingomonas nostoxanthinifaciens]
MEAGAVKRVVIAGGGTAGWVAAAALVRHLGPLLSITLVESDEIGTVGVGESTIPTARSFHNLLGINEPVFVRETHATFKLGIAFENWRAEGDRYFHPFGSVGRSVWMGDFQHFWLEAAARGFAAPYGAYSPEQLAAEAGRFSNDPEAGLAYAYHLDATAYARFLRGLAEPAGVRRVEGRIERVTRDGESGFITGLELASGERVEGDFFIDCTGFRALLIGETLGVSFEDWGQWIATDRALAVQTESVGPPVPYTRAIAYGAGWRWQIPLQTRVGNGLVYASADLSDDEARQRLLDALDGRPLFDPRAIRFRTGMRSSAWSHNCVALGLAGGFIEPLESTSIHLIHVAVTRLLQLFPFHGIDDAIVSRFNAQATREGEGIRDFIILHYKLTERADTAFWRRCRDMAIPDTLTQRIALFAESAMAYQAGEDLFRVDSWVAVMLGQGIRPAHWHALAQLMPDAELRKAFTDLEAGVRARVAKLPPHEAAFAN